MSQEPYYCTKCEKKHFRGKVYEEHAEFVRGIKITPAGINPFAGVVQDVLNNDMKKGKVIMITGSSNIGELPRTYSVTPNLSGENSNRGTINPDGKEPIIRDDSGKTIGITIPSIVDKVIQLQSEDEMFAEIEETNTMRALREDMKNKDKIKYIYDLSLDADAIPEDVKPSTKKKRGYIRNPAKIAMIKEDGPFRPKKVYLEEVTEGNKDDWMDDFDLDGDAIPEELQDKKPIFVVKPKKRWGLLSKLKKLLSKKN